MALSSAVGSGYLQPFHCILNMVCPVSQSHCQLRTAAEADQEELIVWIGILQQRLDRLLSLGQPRFHAVAGIEDQADACWRALRCEMCDDLLDAVLKDAELLF
jgi:hypothetical protein